MGGGCHLCVCVCECVCLFVYVCVSVCMFVCVICVIVCVTCVCVCVCVCGYKMLLMVGNVFATPFIWLKCQAFMLKLPQNLLCPHSAWLKPLPIHFVGVKLHCPSFPFCSHFRTNLHLPIGLVTNMAGMLQRINLRPRRHDSVALKAWMSFRKYSKIKLCKDEFV